MPTNPIQVLIVDDHFVVREGLRSLLQREADFVLAGEAVNGVEGVSAYETLQPHVTLMDLRMPVQNGVEATRIICAKYPLARILVLSSFAGDEDIHSALEAGAMGYIFKQTSGNQIVPAIRAVMEGLKWLPDEVSRHLNMRKQSDELTAREQEILLHMGLGETNKEIGQTFGITDETVKSHVKKILGKLNVRSRTEAVTVALRRGLIHLPEP